MGIWISVLDISSIALQSTVLVDFDIMDANFLDDLCKKQYSKQASKRQSQFCFWGIHLYAYTSF